MMHSFRRFLVSLLLLSSFCLPTASAQISRDATILALRFQISIPLDTVLARHIDSVLSKIRSANPLLSDIHALPDYSDTTLAVSVSASAHWTDAWRTGQVVTGDHTVDSLSALYGLRRVDTLWSNTFLLRFSRPLKMPFLAEVYRKIPSVFNVELDGIVGDGDRIFRMTKPGKELYVFSKGTGDCPAGCLYRTDYYVSVSLTPGPWTVNLEQQGVRSFTTPKIFLWNYPQRYAVTMFPSLDSMRSAAKKHPDWWVRQHAVEGMKRLLLNSSPWVGEDLNSTVWDTLHTQALRSRIAVRTDLQSIGSTDADIDVKISAMDAWQSLAPTSVAPAVSVPGDAFLGQNFPNPFNPRTVIPFRLPQRAFAEISVSDLLGRRIAVLASDVFDAGEHRVEWNAEHAPSGLYFAMLRVNGGQQVRRMLLLK